MKVSEKITTPVEYRWLTNHLSEGWTEKQNERIYDSTKIQINHGTFRWLFLADENFVDTQVFVLSDEDIAFFQYQFTPKTSDRFKDQCLASLKKKLQERCSEHKHDNAILLHKSAEYVWQDRDLIGAYAGLPKRTVFRTYWNGRASFITIEGTVADEGGRVLHKWRTRKSVKTSDLPEIIKKIDKDWFTEKCLRQSSGGGLADNWEYQTGGCLKTVLIGSVSVSACVTGVVTYLLI